MAYKFFDKKSVGSGAKRVNTKITPQNQQLAEELHKPIIRKFKKRKVYSAFKDNIWGADLADMQLLSRYNKGIKFLLSVIDIFSKYAWVVPLKDKKGISVVKAFQIILKQSNSRQRAKGTSAKHLKPNKIWADKGSEFYNASFKKWFQDNDIIMYSTHNEGKSVVAERFIRTLKSKIYKYITSISKNVYIDKLDDIVDEYNNTYHTKIKMKPADVKDNTYINADKEINNKDPKFKVGDSVRISKYKNIFAKSRNKYGFKQYNHVDTSSFASKTNLAALKIEVDQKDVDKLKTTPTDLDRLSNLVKIDVVKKTDYNTKVTSIEAQIVGLTKNRVDNLADITKLKAIDTNSFVTRTKFSADINALDDKIDGVEKKIPDISGLATKTSLNSCLQTSTFNSKVTEVENKIKAADIIAKSANTKANTIRSDLTDYAKKADVATDITTIKNDYVTNASLTSQLNDLKSQHIATEVTGIDNKTKKNASDILALENTLKQKEDTINENERGLGF